MRYVCAPRCQSAPCLLIIYHEEYAYLTLPYPTLPHHMQIQTKKPQDAAHFFQVCKASQIHKARSVVYNVLSSKTTRYRHVPQTPVRKHHHHPVLSNPPPQKPSTQSKCKFWQFSQFNSPSPPPTRHSLLSSSQPLSRTSHDHPPLSV